MYTLSLLLLFNEVWDLIIITILLIKVWDFKWCYFYSCELFFWKGYFRTKIIINIKTIILYGTLTRQFLIYFCNFSILH